MDRRTFLETLALPAMALAPGAHSTPQPKPSLGADRKIAVAIAPAWPTTAEYEPFDDYQAVEIAAVEIIDKQISGTYFRGYLNPERDSTTTKLAEFLRGNTMVLHGAPDALQTLRRAFSTAGHEFSYARTHAVIDITEVLDRKLASDDCWDFLHDVFNPMRPYETSESQAFTAAMHTARVYLALAV